MRSWLCAAALALSAATCAAAEIAIGLGADVTSMDPHFHNLTPNSNVAGHIFDTLVAMDPRMRLRP